MTSQIGYDASTDLPTPGGLPPDDDFFWPPAEDHGPNPLFQLVRARVVEFLRKPEAIFWVYVFPLLMAVALGIAFRSRPATVVQVDVADVRGAGDVIARVLQDADRRQQTPQTSPRALLDEGRFGSSPGGEPTAPDRPQFDVRVVSPEVGRQRLRTGKTQLLIVPRPRLEAPTAPRGSNENADRTDERSALASDKPATTNTFAAGRLEDMEIEYVYDPTRPESSLARRLVDDAVQRAAGRKDPVVAADAHLSEPGGRYIDFLIPGLMGASLLGGGLWGIGFVTVDMRVRNLLKRFVTTPMRKSDFLLGMMISRFLFMVTEVLLLVLFAHWIFDVVIAGSVISIMLLVLLGAIMFAGVGLLVASRAKTLETASGLMNLVMLPMWLLSGIFFSPERFPDVVQPLIQALPLTPLIHALRAVMIEGAGLASLWSDVAIMAAWSVISFVLALRWFRWF